MSDTTIPGLIESVRHLNEDSTDETVDLLYAHVVEQKRAMAELDLSFWAKLKQIHEARKCAR